MSNMTISEFKGYTIHVSLGPFYPILQPQCGFPHLPCCSDSTNVNNWWLNVGSLPSAVPGCIILSDSGPTIVRKCPKWSNELNQNHSTPSKSTKTNSNSIGWLPMITWDILRCKYTFVHNTKRCLTVSMSRSPVLQYSLQMIYHPFEFMHITNPLLLRHALWVAATCSANINKRF